MASFVPDVRRLIFIFAVERAKRTRLKANLDRLQWLTRKKSTRDRSTSTVASGAILYCLEAGTACHFYTTLPARVRIAGSPTP